MLRDWAVLAVQQTVLCGGVVCLAGVRAGLADCRPRLASAVVGAGLQRARLAATVGRPARPPPQHNHGQPRTALRISIQIQVPEAAAAPSRLPGLSYCDQFCDVVRGGPGWGRACNPRAWL